MHPIHACGIPYASQTVAANASQGGWRTAKLASVHVDVAALAVQVGSLFPKGWQCVSWNRTGGLQPMAATPLAQAVS